MSRIGKHPVPVPDGVEVALAGQTLTVAGKLGELRRTLPKEVEIVQENGAITVRPRDDSKRARSMWGLSRTLALIHRLTLHSSTAMGFRSTA